MTCYTSGVASDPPEGRTLRLRDGRFLGYAEYGDPQGKPLFYFHGFPGSRLEARLAHDAAKAGGVRVISLDRPGMGLSDFQRGRRFTDWPEDVVQASDAQGIGRFAVMGLSGGGPYVAVCALKLPQRLTAAGIISGVAPLDSPGATAGMSRQNRLIFGLGRRLPWLARPMWWLARQASRDPDRLLNQIRRSAAEPDKAILDRPQVRAIYKADLQEAFRRGSRGLAHELVVYSRPWGFRLEDITMPVHLWQGEADANVPVSMGRYQASAIPNCRATFYPGEGHLMSIDRMEEILAALLS